MNYQVTYSDVVPAAVRSGDLSGGTIAVHAEGGRSGCYLLRIKTGSRNLVVSLTNPHDTWDGDGATPLCRPLAKGQQVVLTGTGE